MSKLEQLLKEKCPNGVEYLSLGELEDNRRILLGRGNVISKKEMIDNPGDYPVYSSSAINNGMIGKYGKYMFDDERISWSIDGGGKFFYRCNEKYSITNVGGWLKVLDKKLSAKYLYYALSNEWKNKHYDYIHKAHPSVIRKEYVLPVPPLEVQREIVGILDNFTLLSAELSAELSARKEQFQNYLDIIYENIKLNPVPLSSIGTLTRGKRFVHADAVDDGIPCIHYGELYTYYGVYSNKVRSHIRSELKNKMRYASTGDVVIVGAGENKDDIGVGVAWEGKENIAVHDACYTLKHSQNPKFISYYLRTSSYHKQIKKYVSEGKICAISKEGIGKALIPIPSLDEQDRIVNILDKFYELCNDISSGLPAEILARQKQYEYYRNKLLTFKRLEA